MQGGMVMPMVSYRAMHDMLHVMMDPTVPQLTPLLVSHPADQFGPGDPWFDHLDPSRQGLAFSRRYGFVMDTSTDPLPEGKSLWIRKVSGSSGLGFYRYRNTEPKAWEPIFGTGASSAAMRWDGMMFHPGVTAPAGTNEYVARFEVYLADTTTGEPAAMPMPVGFDLRWTTVPDGRPSLSIGARVVVDWDMAATGWVLESAAEAVGAEWTREAQTPVTIQGRATVVLEAGSARRYFRLARLP